MFKVSSLILEFVIFFVLGTISHVFAFADGDSQREKIKIGYYENEKFQEGASEGEDKSGYSYEYLQKISSINGWKYEYVYGSWAELYNLFLEGKIDLLAGLGYSENRLSLFNYPDFPMGYEGYYIYIRDDDKSISIDHKSMNGKKIGTIHGLMEKVIREWINDNKINAEIIVYDEIQDRDNALLEGKVDAFIGEGASVTAKDNIFPLLKVKNVDMYLCVAKGRTDLLDELNEALTELDNREPYYIYELSRKHFNNTAVTSRVTAVEDKWLENHDYTIEVGYLDDFMPYSSTDKNGNVIGIIVDVLKNGFGNLKTNKPIKLKFKPYNSTQEMIAAVKNHDIELMFPISDDLNYLEKLNLFSSKDVISSAMNLVYKDNLTDSEKGTIAVNVNNQIQFHYAEDYFSKNHKIYLNSAEECLDAVVSGKADATLLSGLRASIILNKSKYDGLSYVELQHNSIQAFGVSSSHKGILPLINQALSSLEDNEALSYLNKYIEQSIDYTFVEFIKKHSLTSSLCLIFILTCIIVLIAFNRVKHRKQQLYYQYAYTDGLTKLLNRRAYEEEIGRYASSMPNDLICVSMDLTGLKNVNDTNGHAAGDELIQESSRLLTAAFGELGKIFRTGGDEFYAILFTTIEKFEEKKSQFQTLCKSWKGIYSDKLNVAIGYATPKDNNNIIDIEKIADKRMYEAKSNWYKSTGVDRRGNKIAYETICSLYLKILKINITNDTFNIVHMSKDENLKNKGFSEKISEWFSNFEKLGNVHQDDIDVFKRKTDLDFLRNYFKEGNSVINITYRRKCDTNYNRVLMEMILADDYDNNNQTLFLCVKQINDLN